MNKVLNLILSFVVFFVGWKLFPSIFQFSSAGAVVIVALLRHVIGAVLAIALVFGFTAIITTTNKRSVILLTVIGMILVAFMFNIIYILVASKVYTGFTFNGNAGALILTSIALSLFSVDVSSKQSNK